MQTTKQPYEFLARWDHEGKLCGAQVQWRYIITDDSGATIAETVSAVESVAVTGNDGFPLADVLQQVQLGAVAATDTANAQRDQARVELQTVQSQLQAVTAERDALKAASQKVPE